MKLNIIYIFSIILLYVTYTVALPYDPNADRCRRKLATVKWRRYKDGWTTPLNTDVVNRYCRLTRCVIAYDDENFDKNERTKQWNACKNMILDEFASYYKASFDVVSSTVNYY